MRGCSVILPRLAIQNDRIDESPSRSNKTEVNSTLRQPKIRFVTEDPHTPKRDPALTVELKQAINERNIFTCNTKVKYIVALNELEDANRENDRKRRKSRAIREIFDSETAYLKQLEIIINFFKKPVIEKNILSRDDAEKVFGMIGTIYNINNELLSMLKENKSHVGDTFSRIAPYFRLYSMYAYDYKMILDILQKNEQSNDEFNKFLCNQESRPEVQTKLTALLIAPIQRISRYCLLMRQVLKNTLPSEDDYEFIKESLSRIEESARRTNEIVQDRENSERLLEIQNSLYCNRPLIIEPGRKLIKEGRVINMDGTRKSQIYLILLTDILLFCKIRKHNLKSKDALKCCGTLHLDNCKIRQNPTSRNVEIKRLETVIMLYVEKQNDFEEWVKVLKASVSKHVANQVSLHRDVEYMQKTRYLYNLEDVNINDYYLKHVNKKWSLGNGIRNFTETEIVLNQPSSTNFEDCTYEGLSEMPQTPSKRKLEEDDLELNNKKSKFKQYAGKVAKLKKRRCIREKTVGDDSQSPEVIRVCKSKNQIVQDAGVNTEINSNRGAEETEVFVFGNPDNRDRGFNFKIRNIFSTIKNSFKQMLGFN